MPKQAPRLASEVQVATFVLPFTRDQFFNVFAVYNEGVWSWQIALYLLASKTWPCFLEVRSV